MVTDDITGIDSTSTDDSSFSLGGLANSLLNAAASGVSTGITDVISGNKAPQPDLVSAAAQPQKSVVSSVTSELSKPVVLIAIAAIGGLLIWKLVK